MNNELLTPRDTLCCERADCPGWLLYYDVRASPPRLPMQDLLRSRVAYYPAAGSDGHALEVFGGSHAAACFIYADFCVGTGAEVRQQLLDTGHRHRLMGYNSVFVHDAGVDEVFPDGFHPWKYRGRGLFGGDRTGFSGAFWSILERSSDRGDDHGPRRLLFLYIVADAFAVLNSLWPAARQGRGAPYGMLLPNRAMGDEWTNYGGYGPMFLAAISNRALPEWLLVDDQAPWPGYAGPISKPSPPRGMNGETRALFRRQGEMDPEMTPEMRRHMLEWPGHTPVGIPRVLKGHNDPHRGSLAGNRGDRPDP